MPTPDKNQSMRPRPQRRWFRRALYGSLICVTTVAVAIYFIEPQYWAHGAWKGRITSGVPSPTYRAAGKLWLSNGGSQEGSFDVSNTRLRLSNLRGNFGREAFPAPVTPDFIPASDAAEFVDDAERVLAVKVGEEVHVYPIRYLMEYEVVNDTVGGRPVFAGYCMMAGLACVYDRRYGDQVHTFAPSGHLYFEDFAWGGKPGFVLWDRETESLWWPPGGKGVSGVMRDVPMKVLEPELWAQSTFEEVVSKHPKALVLAELQRFAITGEWPTRYDDTSAGRDRFRWGPPSSIAPRWGENDEL